MTTHKLKTEPEFFDAIADGTKRFEIRKADRDFKSGDTLLFREWKRLDAEYTGREIEAAVTFREFVHHNPGEEDTIAMSIRLSSEPPDFRLWLRGILMIEEGQDPPITDMIDTVENVVCDAQHRGYTSLQAKYKRKLAEVDSTLESIKRGIMEVKDGIKKLEALKMHRCFRPHGGVGN